MKTKIIQKVVAIFMLIAMVISNLSGIVFASTPMKSADLKNKGECGLHLQFKKSNGSWTYIICTFVTYKIDGKEYPAFCLNASLDGVGEADEYTVDVSKELDNDVVWRTIINGYPYKTPEELGVDNKWDAFVATKQAVYCALYDWDAEERYRGEDDRGKAIAKAIVKMVKKGREGKETPYDGTIEAKKVGSLKEDGNYYSQEYKVNCSVDINSYTLNATGLPTGAIITNLDNIEKNTFKGNENFKVKIPKTQLFKDYNIKINVQAKAKTYSIFYGKTRISGTQNYALTYDPISDVNTSTTLKVEAITGELKIKKIDEDTKEAIENVEFQLTDANGKVVATEKTNKDGIANFSKLISGKYILKELATNKKYIINNENFNITINPGETTTKEITNKHTQGSLKVIKTDKDNNKIGIGNVEFDLYSEELQKVIGTYRTDVNGEISINNLRTGIYKLKEKTTNKWYNLIEDQQIEIEADKEYIANIQNELKKGQVKVIKVDKQNNEIKLKGVEFEILDSENNVVEKLITDENGEAISKKYPLRDYENLKIRETKTLKTYALDKEVKTITLKENEITTIKFENDKEKHDVEISKADVSGKEIEGATLQLYSKENKLIEEWVSTNKSHIVQGLIEGETYRLHEEISANGYVKASDIEFTITEDKQQKVTMIDKIVDVTKTDLTNGEEIEGAELIVTDEERK